MICCRGLLKRSDGWLCDADYRALTDELPALIADPRRQRVDVRSGTGAPVKPVLKSAGHAMRPGSGARRRHVWINRRAVSASVYVLRPVPELSATGSPFPWRLPGPADIRPACAYMFSITASAYDAVKREISSRGQIEPPDLWWSGGIFIGTVRRLIAAGTDNVSPKRP